ncbi:NAC domain-containing protein 1-like [Rutidosis leptorrhynchoides]|uniref:NAC domain-containing protein 1-like n=1 Tax=Rutidosis leptorrhynchoides TaxID=125765 RepID=UPI003A9A1F43
MSQKLTVPVPVPPTSLAPGFRFHPSDDELVLYYLKRKVFGKPFRYQAVAEVDIYNSEPWQLPEFSLLNSRDKEWYFFSPINKNYGTGFRVKRVTKQGFWKSTGQDRAIQHNEETIGFKKTLVFHTGRTASSERTDWVMHEYRLPDHELQLAQDAYVLCRIFEKSGLGPPIGHCYAPFLEEEWDDDKTANGDGTQNDVDVVQEGAQTGICKRERLENLDLNLEPELCLSNKRSKQTEPNMSNANSSEDSVTTNEAHGGTTNYSLAALKDFSLLEAVSAYQVNRLARISSFDVSTLEKSVPEGYLKFISNLEKEIIIETISKENWKIEVMRAQMLIKILQTRVDCLTATNNELRMDVK